MRKTIYRLLMLLLSITIVLLFSEDPNYAYASTGHAEFRQVIIPRQSNARLIVDMSNAEVSEAQNKVRRRAFGWNVYPINKNVTVEYVGQTIFAKANRTSKPITIAFNYTEEETLVTSVNTTGSIGFELKGKILQLSTGLDTSIRREIGQKNETVRSEDLKFNIVINANRQVSLTVKGEAILNNGAGKYYFFGITFKKGTWEYIDIFNEYYEFYEKILY